MQRKILPHDSFKHDVYNTPHEAHSDSDDDHDQDHADEHGEHHHDEHSDVHHHHETLGLPGGQQIQANVFHGDPFFGNSHIHLVHLKKNGVLKEYRLYHEGREHVDVPASNPMALLYNSRTILKRKEEPLMVAHETKAHAHKEHVKKAVPMPSAPQTHDSDDDHDEVAPPSYEQVSRHPYTTFGAAKPLEEKLLQTPEKDAGCCSCTIL